MRPNLGLCIRRIGLIVYRTRLASRVLVCHSQILLAGKAATVEGGASERIGVVEARGLGGIGITTLREASAGTDHSIAAELIAQS